MRRIAITAGAVAAVLAPASAAAAPNRQDRTNAARECRAERASMGAENFRRTYGANRDGRNAFGKCVSRRARDEARERKLARRAAVRECKVERAMSEAAFRGAHGGRSFAELYGTNANGRNAFGKCVSAKAAQHKQEADDRDAAVRHAQRSCRDEQRLDPAAFRERYGTNRNKRNAFGKCVSQRAKEQRGQDGYKPSKPRKRSKKRR